MFDAAGTLYYDTEDPRTGLLIVDGEGTVYNKFVDAEGKVGGLLACGSHACTSGR